MAVTQVCKMEQVIAVILIGFSNKTLEDIK